MSRSKIFKDWQSCRSPLGRVQFVVFQTFLQLLIYSLLVSIVDNRLVLHRNTLMNIGSFLSSALWISKLDTHSSLQTFIHFTRILLIFRLVISSMSIWCHQMSWQFRLIFLEFAGQPIPETLSVIVGLQQYIDTFLKASSPNFIQTASSCRFEKFRIKRNPNRAPLDYPLDLTK